MQQQAHTGSSSLDSDRYRRLLAEWKAFLERSAPSGAEARDAETPLRGSGLAAGLASEPANLWRGEAIDQHTTAERLHELRIDAKKLRYLIDVTPAFYESADLERILRALKKLQRVLGDFNDAQVQEKRLLECGRALAVAGGPAGVLLAVGRLAEQSRQRSERLREQVIDGTGAVLRARHASRSVGARSRDGVRRGADDERGRRLQHEGWRREDDDGGESVVSRRGRRPADPALGPRPAGSVQLRFSRPAPRRGFRKKSLRAGEALAAAIKETDYSNLDLLPADFAYRKLDRFLGNFGKPERVMARLIEILGRDYDVVFLDCPAGFSLLTEGIFAAADAVLVPTIRRYSRCERSHDCSSGPIVPTPRQNWRLSSAWSTAARHCIGKHVSGRRATLRSSSRDRSPTRASWNRWPSGACPSLVLLQATRDERVCRNLGRAPDTSSETAGPEPAAKRQSGGSDASHRVADRPARVGGRRRVTGCDKGPRGLIRASSERARRRRRQFHPLLRHGPPRCAARRLCARVARVHGEFSCGRCAIRRRCRRDGNDESAD